MSENCSEQGVYAYSLFSDGEIEQFKRGEFFFLYEKFGAHLVEREGVKGVYFSVWAPNAENVFVVGEFNGWNKGAHKLFVRWDSTGIWEGFIPGVSKGTMYKFNIESKHNHYAVEKKDPYAFYSEEPPKTGTVVWDLDYAWKDDQWMEARVQKNALDAPVSIYEVHLGSWRRMIENGEDRFLTYRELADQLVSYVKDMGFTHVEFMPVMEHPFYGSWGYQTVGYFAPTSRFGPPQDFMYLIDQLHQQDIGVILDWVPSHFPSDEHGLVYFDGTHVYEHSDPQKGIHPDWKCYVFNNGRTEVVEFLISSACFWMDKYHVDGLRVDAVASMLYLDYSRKEGEWEPNKYGSNENLESISLIKKMNEVIYSRFPGVQMIAEESTAWTKVSRPTFDGGLGFGMKWNMGWMHDTLQYFSKDPIYRKYHHNELTFSMLYAFTENFVLSLSHDEVVHGKGSLITKMPCDDWQKFANLRLLYAYMWSHPGKKLLFMGGEFAQWAEWNHDKSLDWHLLQHDSHQGIQTLVKDLNRLYRTEKAFHKNDFNSIGFEWVDCSAWEQGVISFLRKGNDEADTIFVVCNFTPATYLDYRVGLPSKGHWLEIFNSNAGIYGGSDQGNGGGVEVEAFSFHGRKYSAKITIPPLGVCFFKQA